MTFFISSNRSITTSAKTRASASIHVDVVDVRYLFDCKLSRCRFSEFSAILILPSETRMRKTSNLDRSRQSSRARSNAFLHSRSRTFGS
jgi:hypothetical protein